MDKQIIALKPKRKYVKKTKPEQKPEEKKELKNIIVKFTF